MQGCVFGTSPACRAPESSAVRVRCLPGAHWIGRTWRVSNRLQDHDAALLRADDERSISFRAPLSLICYSKARAACIWSSRSLSRTHSINTISSTAQSRSRALVTLALKMYNTNTKCVCVVNAIGPQDTPNANNVLRMQRRCISFFVSALRQDNGTLGLLFGENVGVRIRIISTCGRRAGYPSVPSKAQVQSN